MKIIIMRSFAPKSTVKGAVLWHESVLSQLTFCEPLCSSRFKYSDYLYKSIHNNERAM